MTFTPSRLVAWLAQRANRRRVYLLARVAIPLLVVAGVLADGQAATVLSVLAAIAGFGAPHLAARHVKP